MIAVNELTDLTCKKKEIIEGLTILLSPHCPYISEEIWEKLGYTTSVTQAKWPEFVKEYLIESSKNYPVSFNGKMRFTLELPLDMSKSQNNCFNFI